MRIFRVQSHESRTLAWWYAKRAHIDFNPPYQRSGSLWDDRMRRRLIDSILNGFDIPKIYMADFSLGPNSLNRKRTLYAVIDGRQRLETIFRFLEDKFTLDESFVYYADPELSLAGLTYSEIRKNFPEVGLDIDNYNLGVMSVITEDLALINELFVRLNTSRPLTGAEIRNAMGGVVPNAIRDLSQHKFFKKKVRFNTSRGQDKNSAAKLLLTEFSGEFVATKRTHLDSFVDMFTAEGIRAETSHLLPVKRAVERVLTHMCAVFEDSDPILRSEGALVVYYWLVRNHYKKFGKDLRHYLLAFTTLSEVPAGNRYSADLYEDVLQYSGYKRNANDEGSLRGRYRILEKWLLLASRYPEVEEMIYSHTE